MIGSFRVRLMLLVLVALILHLPETVFNLPFGVFAQSVDLHSVTGCKLHRLPEIKTFLSDDMPGYAAATPVLDQSEPAHLVFTGVAGAICDENNMDTTYNNGDQIPIDTLTQLELQAIFLNNDIV